MKKNDENYISVHKIEARSVNTEVRAEAGEEKDTLIGLPIVFNSETVIGDMWREVIAPEAITRDALKDVPFLVNHDTDGIPLARSRNNTANSTMRLSLENDGVHMEADLDKTNPKAAELLSAVCRGDVSGMSFAFHVSADKWDDLDSETPKRTITGIDRIFEVSAVTYPAYEATSIVARSMDIGKAELDNERKALESAKKTEEARRALLEKINKILEVKE